MDSPGIGVPLSGKGPCQTSCVSVPWFGGSQLLCSTWVFSRQGFARDASNLPATARAWSCSARLGAQHGSAPCSGCNKGKAAEGSSQREEPEFSQREKLHGERKNKAREGILPELISGASWGVVPFCKNMACCWLC